MLRCRLVAHLALVDGGEQVDLGVRLERGFLEAGSVCSLRRLQLQPGFHLCKPPI
jgi:hypothetical protein